MIMMAKHTYSRKAHLIPTEAVARLTKPKTFNNIYIWDPSYQEGLSQTYLYIPTLRDRIKMHVDWFKD